MHGTRIDRSRRILRISCIFLLALDLGLAPMRPAAAVGLELGASDEALPRGTTPSSRSFTREERAKLVTAAADPALTAWQRDYMIGLAAGSGPGPGPQPSNAPSSTREVTVADGTWVPLFDSPRPPKLIGHTAIYDSTRDRMIVFGGISAVGDPPKNDTWVLWLASTPYWTQLSAGNPPPARYSHSATYDPLGDRMVVFGGYDGSSRLNDVWVLPLTGNPNWTQLFPTGTPPSPRNGHTAIYDANRHRIVVFGGYGGAPLSYLNDTSALSLAGAGPSWQGFALTGNLPERRSEHAAIYDPKRDRMVMFGGRGSGGVLNDTWEFSLSLLSWTPLAQGPPPQARSGHSAVYEVASDRMIIYGGHSWTGSLDDTWAFKLYGVGYQVWEEVVPANGVRPRRREYPAAVYDHLRRRMVIFGGWDNGALQITLDDTWVLALAGAYQWTQLMTPSTPPPARREPAAIYDPKHDRMVIFGGYDGSQTRNDTWILQLGLVPAWSQLPPTFGGPPPPRSASSAIYYPTYPTTPDRFWDAVFVFGGFSGGAVNDTWMLSIDSSPQPQWSEERPYGSLPPARYGHTAIYDPLRDRMVVFGGYNGSYLNDTWALYHDSFGVFWWTQLSPSGVPPAPRYAASAVYDPYQGRMLLFGGETGGARLNDVWELSLRGPEAWNPVATVGSPPSQRDGHSAIFDPIRNRMVVFGGFFNSGFLNLYLNDSWELSLAGTPTWSELSPEGPIPAGRFQHKAIYDPFRDQLVMFGGSGNTPYFNDTWALVWGTPTDVPSEPTGLGLELTLEAPRPNPFQSAVSIRFRLASASTVHLDVLDVSGRTVRVLADGPARSGWSAHTWDGRNGVGQLTGPGVYFLRLQSAGRTANRKVLRL